MALKRILERGIDTGSDNDSEREWDDFLARNPDKRAKLELMHVKLLSMLHREELPTCYCPVTESSEYRTKELDRVIVVSWLNTQSLSVNIQDVLLHISDKMNKLTTFNYKEAENGKYYLIMKNKITRDLYVTVPFSVQIRGVSVKFERWNKMMKSDNAPLNRMVWVCISGIPDQHKVYESISDIALFLGHLCEVDLINMQKTYGPVFARLQVEDKSKVPPAMWFGFEKTAIQRITIDVHADISVKQFNDYGLDRRDKTYFQRFLKAVEIETGRCEMSDDKWAPSPEWSPKSNSDVETGPSVVLAPKSQQAGPSTITLEAVLGSFKSHLAGLPGLSLEVEPSTPKSNVLVESDHTDVPSGNSSGPSGYSLDGSPNSDVNGSGVPFWCYEYDELSSGHETC